ncbi:tetratricopeptide repeat protein [Capnocytophaga sp.]|uniref:tetratricopeptide repeat protein n=1 Tax=Capnocytophaga sp. TaxID=44737 RepID=UPI0026DB453D|nr:tetratricopeptide repeat protein [Capnocytophaga sp.]MDO5104635.1 tetratricopeptide repeat protein [Capnocytophaga sp.]
MKRTIFSLFSLLVFNQWMQGQQTEIFTNASADFQKAVSLYNRKLYKPAQHLFRKEQQGSSDRDIQIQSQYYVASTAALLGELGADMLMEKFIEEHPESPLSTGAYMRMADFYFQRGNYKDVLKWYRKVNDASVSREERSKFYFQKGYALFSTGSRKEAEKYFNLVKSTKEYGADANYYLGYIAYDSEDYKKAESYFEQVKGEESLDKNVSYFQANMKFKQGNFEQALNEGLKQLQKTKNPQETSELNKIIGESYFNLGKYNQAIPYLKEYKGKRGKFSNTDFYYLGYVHYKNKDYVSAIDQFNKIIDGNDHVAQNAYYHLAECYLNTGQKQQALNAFRNAYQMDYDAQIKKDAHLNYARLSYEIGNPYESVPEVLLAYARKYPNDNKEEIQSLLIDSYISSGNYQAAISLLEQSNDPRDREVYKKVSFYRGLELFNELQYPQALDYLKKAAGSNDAVLAGRALYWLGETSYQLKDFANAKNFYSQFLNNSNISKTDEYKHIHYSLAYADFNLKNYKGAIENFEKYLKENPKPNAWTNDALLRLADSYFVEGKYWPAMERYNKLIAGKSSDEDYAAYQKAISYGFVDRSKKKIEDLEDFIKKYRNSNLRPNALFELGNAYVSDGNTAKGVQYYKQIQTEYKGNNLVPRSMLREGLVYYNKNNNQEALKIFKTIARDYPQTNESAQAVATAKLIYIDMGKVNEYATWAKGLGYVEVSDLELESATYEAAERQHLQQNEKEAIAGFEKYIKDFPNGMRLSNAQFYLAQLYEGANQKSKAVTLYDEVIKSGSTEFREQSLVKLSQILLDAGSYLKAKPYLEDLEKTATVAQNKVYAQSNLMRVCYNEKLYDKAVEYANKVLAEKTIDNRIKNDAYNVLARSYIKIGNEAEARKAYQEVAKTATGSMAAEAMYYNAYFKHKDGKFKESNEVIQKLAKEYGGYKEFAAKGLVVMAKNFYGLKDSYQATYILENVITNFKEYPEVVEEAKKELTAVKAEAAKSNSSVKM